MSYDFAKCTECGEKFDPYTGELGRCSKCWSKKPKYEQKALKREAHRRRRDPQRPRN